MVAKVATRERPILFGGAMVKAILSGSKSQTRRVMKVPPPDDDFDVGFYHPTMIDRRADGWEEYPGDEVFGAFSRDGEWGIKSPFVPGMELWVRETWRPDFAEADIYYRADGASRRFLDHEEWFASMYRKGIAKRSQKWRPSIFMPRFASRLTLEVTDVRVEKIQSISDQDARAEGVEPISTSSIAEVATEDHIKPFAWLWDSINAKRDGGKYSWEKSPWIWVVTFKRIDNGR